MLENNYRSNKPKTAYIRIKQDQLNCKLGEAYDQELFEKCLKNKSLINMTKFRKERFLNLPTLDRHLHQKVQRKDDESKTIPIQDIRARYKQSQNIYDIKPKDGELSKEHLFDEICYSVIHSKIEISQNLDREVTLRRHKRRENTSGFSKGKRKQSQCVEVEAEKIGMYDNLQTLEDDFIPPRNISEISYLSDMKPSEPDVLMKIDPPKVDKQIITFSGNRDDSIDNLIARSGKIEIPEKDETIRSVEIDNKKARIRDWPFRLFKKYDYVSILDSKRKRFNEKKEISKKVNRLTTQRDALAYPLIKEAYFRITKC